MLVKQPVRDLLGGISRSAPWQRAQNEVNWQTNVIPSRVRGLAKRPPFALEDTLTGAWNPAALLGSRMHTVDLGDGQKFRMIFDGAGGIRVLDEAGNAKTVNKLVSANYLITDSKRMKAATVGKSTYILNPEITAATRTPTLGTGHLNTALVWVRDNGASTDYLGINLKSGASSVTGTTAVAGDSSMDALASDLVSALNTDDTGNEYTITRNGSMIRIERVDEAEFDIYNFSNLDDDHIRIYSREQGAETLGEIPNEYIPDGHILPVSGSPDTDVDDFYVKWDGTRWNEITKPGDGYALDAATMPHVLIYKPATDDFDYTYVEYEERTVGDSKTNPEPSFMGDTLDEIFFAEGRLGLIAGNKIVMSRPAERGAFFRSTVRSYQDNAPVDVESSVLDAAGFHSVLTWNERTYLFSPSGQFLLSGDPVISPRTVQIVPVSSYETTEEFRPKVSGSKAFLVSKQGASSRVMAWTHHEDQPAQAADLSAPVSDYIAGAPTSFAVDDSLGFLALATDDNPARIYVFFYAAGPDGSLFLSNWGEWGLVAGSKVEDMDIESGKLLAVVHLDTNLDGTYDDTHLVSLDVRQALTGNVPIGLDYGTHEYASVVELNPIYMRDREGQAETTGRLNVQFLDIFFDENPTDVILTIEREGRTLQEVTHTSDGTESGPNVLHAPIRARGPRTKLKLTCTGLNDFCVTGLYWEGNYHTNHRRI